MAHWYRLKQLLLPIASVIIVAVLSAGCAAPVANNNIAACDKPGVPVEPQVTPAKWTYDDFCKQDCQIPAAGDAVAEIALSYLSRGRDFREPEGPDGYVLRMVLMDEGYNSVAVEGDLIVALFAELAEEENQAALRPLRYWQLPGRFFSRYWLKGKLLNSYLLRLDWGPDEMPKGNYILAVRLRYKQGQENRVLGAEMPFGDN